MCLSSVTRRWVTRSQSSAPGSQVEDTANEQEMPHQQRQGELPTRLALGKKIEHCARLDSSNSLNGDQNTCQRLRPPWLIEEGDDVQRGATTLHRSSSSSSRNSISAPHRAWAITLPPVHVLACTHVFRDGHHAAVWSFTFSHVLTATRFTIPGRVRFILVAKLLQIFVFQDVRSVLKAG